MNRGHMGSMNVAVALAIVVGGCGSPAKPVKQAPIVVTPFPSPSPAPAPATTTWPVPMRVMTWTADGLVQVGTLPDAPPAQAPSQWYVEPARMINDAEFRAIVAMLRREKTPGLSLRGHHVSSSWLGELVDLPELTALVLDDTDVDGKAFAPMKLSLKRLYLARTFVDDKAIEALAAAHPLEVIGLEDCPVGDGAIEALSKVVTLRAINAAGTRVTDAGGALLGALPKLEVVDLGRTLVGVKTVDALASHPLHQLFLDRTRVGRAVTKLASMAPRLERIDLSALVGYRPIDSDIEWIAKAPNLVEVGLSRSRVSDRLVVEIAKLPRLKHIRLAGTPITAKSIEKLVARVELEEVDLAETGVTDAQAAALIAMPKLKILRLDQTTVGDAGLAAPSPELVELYLSRTKVTDAGLTILDATPKLEALGLGETGAGDATVSRIVKLKSLHTLVLTGARAKREVLAGIASLTLLERLYLDETRADAALLRGLDRLRILHVANTDISDEALAGMRAMQHLEELTIGDTRVTAKIVDELHLWPRLRTLTLVGLDLGDKHLAKLAKAATLTRLDLSGTEVTDPAPLAALPNLVELGLSQTRLTTAGKTSANAIAKRGVVVVR